jgi:hypothetical protein
VLHTFVRLGSGQVKRSPRTGNNIRLGAVGGGKNDRLVEETRAFLKQCPWGGHSHPCLLFSRAVTTDAVDVNPKEKRHHRPLGAAENGFYIRRFPPYLALLKQ